METKNVKTEITSVTPNMAAHWLSNNNGRNRRISNSAVNAYAEEMAAGRWKLTNQGIAFYSDGTLADGQHRLAAIVQAGEPVTMLVTYGLENEAVNGIDQHRKRTLNDVLTMKQEFGTVSAIDVATLRMCYSTTKKATPARVEIMFKDNAAELKKVSEMFGRSSSGVCSATPRAAVLMALKNKLDEQKVAEFVEVLKSGVSENSKQRVVILVRDEILKGRHLGGDSKRREFLKKIQHALKKYVDGAEVKQLKAPEYLTFPYFENID